MSKKSHKKLRDLHRLQSLYGNAQVPTSNAMLVNDTPVAMPKITTQAASAAISHTHAPEVIRDLRGLLGIIVLMMGLLLVMYWLVNTTDLAQSVINFANRLV